MTTISIVPESPGKSDARFLAQAGERRSTGKTAGAALDSLTAQMKGTPSALVGLQMHEPDTYFDEQQRPRLQDLMNRWRSARDRGASLPVEEQIELESLVQAEVKASQERAETLARGHAS